MARPVSIDVARLAVRPDGGGEGTRRVPEETAVALTFNGTGHAVMMASPADLEDFAIGFALTEGIVAGVADVDSVEAADLGAGIELRLWIDEARMGALADRRRRMAGPVGCGLCGIESLEEAMRAVPPVAAGLVVTAADVVEAVAALAPAQVLGRATRAVHAAAFWRPGGRPDGAEGSAGRRGLVALREDVGRHNALDKLVGALARTGVDAATGVVVVSSRLSVEMVQKTAIAGAAVLVAVSAPTALAIRAAEAAGMTLIGVARGDDFEIFTHAWRVRGLPPPERPLPERSPAGPPPKAPPRAAPPRGGGRPAARAFPPTTPAGASHVT